MDKVFGHDWADIQAMQQRTYQRPVIDTSKPGVPAPTDSDHALLAEHGSLEALESAGLYGVADRLRHA